jgi:hypothetical protein
MNILFNRLVARDEEKQMALVATKQAWETHFDERQRKEIAYCIVYKDNFGHGTDGHNIRLIVAKMAELLTMGLIPPVQAPIDPSKPSIPKKPAALQD